MSSDIAGNILVLLDIHIFLILKEKDIKKYSQIPEEKLWCLNEEKCIGVGEKSRHIRREKDLGPGLKKNDRMGKIEKREETRQ